MEIYLLYCNINSSCFYAYIYYDKYKNKTNFVRIIYFEYFTISILCAFYVSLNH